MRADELGKQIGKYLAEDYTVAVSPDHPRLFVAPDVLVGGKGELAAIFIPKSTELASVDDLLVRLAVSRLALASHMRCILLYDNDSRSTTIAELLHLNFHLTLPASEYRSLRFLLAEPSNDSHVQPVPREVRRRTYVRGNAFFLESQQHTLPAQPQAKPFYPRKVFHDLVEQKDYKIVGVPSWAHNYRESRRRLGITSLLEVQNSILAATEMPKNRSVLDVLKPYCNSSIRLDYKMDNGTPYISGFPWPLKLLVTDTLPRSQADPLKPLRVAAFAGWIMIQAESTEEVELCINKLNNSIVETLYEPN